jgi:hypothetical protein
MDSAQQRRDCFAKTARNDIIKGTPMKKIPSLLLLTILLASCATAVTPATPSPAVTNTPAPTATLTLTPTPQPTPTQTPNPNMPADATGEKTVDGKKVYIKESEGRTYEWIKQELTMVGGEKINIEGWYALKTIGDNGKPGAIPLIRPEIRDYGTEFGTNRMTLYARLLVAEEVGKLGADDAVVRMIVPKAELDGTKNFDFLLLNYLWKRVESKYPMTKEGGHALLRALYDGSLLIPYKGLSGWKSGETITTIVIDKNRIINGVPVQNNKAFIKWKEQGFFYSCMTEDENGNPVLLVASDQPVSDLSDRQILDVWLIIHLSALIDKTGDVTRVHPGYIPYINELTDLLVSSPTVSGSSVPIIEIEPLP